MHVSLSILSCDPFWLSVCLHCEHTKKHIKYAYEKGTWKIRDNYTFTIVFTLHTEFFLLLFLSSSSCSSTFAVFRVHATQLQFFMHENAFLDFRGCPCATIHYMIMIPFFSNKLTYNPFVNEATNKACKKVHKACTQLIDCQHRKCMYVE